MHGADHIRKICEDILKVLTWRESEVDWSSYSSDISQFRARWTKAQNEGVAYGWQETISDDERMMIVTIGKLFAALVIELRNELQVP
jgi:hypothetical protein